MKREWMHVLPDYNPW